MAFIATPGIGDEVRKSPAFIGPFSVETLTDTRPARATTTGKSSVFVFVSPRSNPGRVEMMPNVSGSYALLDFLTPAAIVPSILTTSPGLMLKSLV